MIAITISGIDGLLIAIATFIAAVGGIIVGLKNHSVNVEIKQLANGTADALRRRCAQLEDFIHSKGEVPPTDPFIAPGEAEKRSD